MKKMIHLADVHFSKENQDLAIASLECALEVGTREQIDAWAFAGDLFDRGVQNSHSAGFPRLVNVIQRMLEVAPILSIEGTVTHDVPGAYDVLCELEAGHRFINLRPDDAQVVAGIMFFGMPEAGKEWLLAGEQDLSADESNRKLSESVRSILLSFGAMRAAQPEFPAILLFHGSVQGSTLQNRTVSADGIGREDLQLAGFDYAALGHVHLEQKIDGLEAYYPGPAYHTDWGHLGTCGCNLVTLEGPGIPPKVERIPFPHPRRVKFSLPWPEPAGDVEGVQAWVCYRATKEEAAKIDTMSYLNSYLLAGALPGSRVTVDLIPTETVRAAEITEKHRLAEKLSIYAEASGQGYNVPTSVELKAAVLEREAEERGAAAGMHFRLRRLRLRGAVGIWKGLRQDEIDIDLDKKDPGLIALIGANGAGKSTLIENMHPYPCMLTRDGKLQDHFRLRDSARELWFVDERTGTEYRALIEIDGANTSGSVKYHLFHGDPPDRPAELCLGWIPLTNGRKEEYETAIEKLIGSLPLFLRSAFVSQRPTKSNPDLSDATKGEKKAIFRELAGLDYIQAYSESAKARAVALESQVTVGRGQITLMERLVAEEPNVQASKFQADVDVYEADVAIGKAVEQGKQLKAEVEQLAKDVAQQDQIGKDIAAAADDAQKKLSQVQAAQRAIKGYQVSLSQRDQAQADVDRHAKLKEQEGAENERLSAINAERARFSAEYGDTLKAHAADVKGLEVQRTRIRTEKARLEGDHRVLLSQGETLQEELAQPLTDECPECGAGKEHWHKDLNAGRAEKDAQLKAIRKKIHTLGNQIMAKEAELIVIKDPANPTPPKLPEADETELTRIRTVLRQIDVVTARATLETAAKAEQEIDRLNVQIAALEGDAAALSRKAEDLRAQLDPKIRPAHAEALKQYEAARTAYTAAKEERATAAAKLEAALKQLEAIAKQKCELEQLRTSLAKTEAEAAEWRYLEQACGPDGIQALELDALGPSIAEVTNRMLSSAYGSRFSVEFRTTRIAGKGAKTRQIEDFSIIVIDNELLTEQPIETLSGGERVWIYRALFDAFAIIRDRTTGIRFLTVFADEADGALDPESRQKYFTMLEAAHQESGRRNTIVITHSPEVQEAIGQKIEMKRTAA
jgi:exonuclease SbcC